MADDGRISAACADAAANWWGDVLMEPPSHRNGDAFQSMLGRMSAARAEPVTEGQRAAFVTALAFGIRHSGCSDRVNLNVDYDPCPELAEAARLAGIDCARFPWKTVMNIWDGEMIEVSRGYGAAFVRIWPRREGSGMASERATRLVEAVRTAAYGSGCEDGADDTTVARCDAANAEAEKARAELLAYVTGLQVEAVRLRGALEVAEHALVRYGDVHLYERLGDGLSRADDDEGSGANKALDTVWEMCPERRWPEPCALDWRLVVGRVLRHHEEEAALLRRILDTDDSGSGTEAADAR